LQNDLTQN